MLIFLKSISLCLVLIKLRIISRYYYLKNLDDELSSTNTYVISDKSENDIVKFCNKYDISVNDFNLPFMQRI